MLSCTSKMQYLVLLLVSVTFGSCKKLHYHRDVGIPLAAKIKATEERILAQEQELGGRITGGGVAPPSSHPYFGGLVITFVNIEGSSSCGSTLISENRLVTAAHCYSDENSVVKEYIVVLGSNTLFTGGQRIATSHVIVHPGWDPETLAHDVAVIYLPISVSFSKSIQPASLADNLSETFVGETGIACGLGFRYEGDVISSDSVLMRVFVKVISQEVCRQSLTWNDGSIIQPYIICTSGAGGVGVCGGDSGGPLIVSRPHRNILVGVISFGNFKCGEEGPAGYARITSNYDFIHEHMYTK